LFLLGNFLTYTFSAFHWHTTKQLEFTRKMSQPLGARGWSILVPLFVCFLLSILTSFLELKRCNMLHVEFTWEVEDVIGGGLPLLTPYAPNIQFKFAWPTLQTPNYTFNLRISWWPKAIGPYKIEGVVTQWKGAFKGVEADVSTLP
jgi:hypothetical protein